MWDAIYASEGCLGQSIWAGIDDTFYIGDEQTVGYGTWGLIDGWRRLKPEYWNAEGLFSPVRIRTRIVWRCRTADQIALENRQNFAEQREMRIRGSGRRIR
jgi:hypothetical protein